MAFYEYGETILKATGVNLTLGGSRILRDLDLEIKDIKRPGVTQGQVVALLGPSGIGKTRLFRILAGLDKPDSGSVSVGPEGRPVETGLVGVVFQHYPLFAHRTVLGNMVVVGRRVGLSSADAHDKAMEILKRFDLDAHAKKYPTQLSGGMRQRAAIAQQFMCSEHFLLMDEPFSGLDPLAVDYVCEFISEMAATHELKTFVVVTHDVTAAIEVADTVWLLGRERDAKGAIIPGARILKTYNLIDRGLAWKRSITSLPEFHDVHREILNEFHRL